MSAPIAVAATLLAYRPFLEPLPRVWDVWAVLILPLSAGIAVVWKSIKCRSMAEVPREAGVLLLWVIGGFAAAAAALLVLVTAVGR